MRHNGLLIGRAVELHSYAGILLLVEIRRTAQRFDGNIVFPDQFPFPFKIFSADVAKQMRQAGARSKIPEARTASSSVFSLAKSLSAAAFGN